MYNNYMDKITLTKREYLGEGYLHAFENIETGEKKYQYCSKEDYEKMGLPGGAKFNPIPEAGWQWNGSAGQTIMVDNPNNNNMLAIGEYTIIDDKYVTFEKVEDSDREFIVKNYSEQEFNNKYTWQ